MRKLFYFDEMLTPKIITFAYWFFLLLAVFSGIGAMFSGFGGFTFWKFLSGLLILIGGGVGARIWSEVTIVLFKINENMKKIADKA